ncbi:MAG: aminotransferase class IV [Peptococcaceae bacterium]|nr:aminotransferase class IV [Peptococcaceae bacterium]
MSQELAWINGTVTSVEEARVPFLDHGYLFGYGVYESMRTYGGRIFALQEHFDRLEKSLKALNLSIDMSRRDLERVLVDLVGQSDLKPETTLYLQITRGPAPRHQVSPETKPIVAIMTSCLHPVSKEAQRQGIQAISCPDERWQHPHIKSLNLLPNALARIEAEKAGAQEAILYNARSVTEGTMSNVFAVLDGVIVTPPADGRILEGVTRVKVMEAAAARGWDIVERYFSIEELRRAEEIFISSTGIAALGVAVLDGQDVGKGRTGPMSLQIGEWFLQEAMGE